MKAELPERCPRIDDAKLATWEQLEKAATPGPWVPFSKPYNSGWSVSGIATQDLEQAIVSCAPNAFGGRPGTDADRDFIAMSRTAVPELLAEVRRLKAELGTQMAIPKDVLASATRLGFEAGELTPELAQNIWNDMVLLSRFGLGVVQHGRVFGPIPADGKDAGA